MSNASLNDSFYGTVVDTLLQPSNIAPGVAGVLSNNGVDAGPQLAIAGGNASAAADVDLSVQQLLAMRYQPLLINNAHAANVISLCPEGNSAGNEAAFSLQQAFNMTTGTSVFLQLCQVGTPGIISLAGSTLTPVTSALSGYSLIRVAAGIVGTSSTATVTITKISPTGSNLF